MYDTLLSHGGQPLQASHASTTPISYLILETNGSSLSNEYTYGIVSWSGNANYVRQHE